jgi:hypothetical protein
MDLRIAVPEEHVAKDVLNAGLEAVTRVNQRLLQNGQVPPFRDAGPGSAVRWQPEPPGAERFDHAAKVLQRGWGDCDDLAPWHAASLRMTGEDPWARAIVVKSGPNRWHALVRRSDRRIDDPSAEAGMPHAVVGDDGCTPNAPPPSLAVCPAILPRMFGGENRPAIAVRANQVTGRYEARADVPWARTNYAMSALSRSPVAHQAIVGAIQGVCGSAIGSGVGHPRHLRRMMALGALVSGKSERKVAQVVGQKALHAVQPLYEQIQGFNFGHLFHALEPIVSRAVSFVPGVGPIAATALDAADHFIPAGHAAPAAPQYARPPMHPVYPPSAPPPGAAAYAADLASSLFAF